MSRINPLNQQIEEAYQRVQSLDIQPTPRNVELLSGIFKSLEEIYRITNSPAENVVEMEPAGASGAAGDGAEDAEKPGKE